MVTLKLGTILDEVIFGWSLLFGIVFLALKEGRKLGFFGGDFEEAVSVALKEDAMVESSQFRLEQSPSLLGRNLD